MPSNDSEASGEPQVVFRGKKRKIYRQRVDERDGEAGSSEHATTDAQLAASTQDNDGQATTAPEDGTGDDGISVSELLRIRNARRSKHGGVSFSAAQSSRHEGDGTDADADREHSLLPHEDAELAQSQDGFGMSRRFAPQTGLVGELVNKHMEEYVESVLASRNRSAANDTDGPGQNPAHPARTTPVVAPKAQPQGMMQGKLQEIDLGEEVRARNIAMTERARRRLEGNPAAEDDEEEDETGIRQKKVRLGRDGKPWRPRNRRGSDDAKRDQLVEQFLSENRLDVYDVQPDQRGTPGGADDDDDGAADDRIAEEFRRDFMDAMSQRRQRKKPALNAPKGAPKPGEEVLKGPKLGGSRNVRSQVRDILLKEQERKR
ncbi:hypothetical protein GQ53DRAFT_798035 [Thozetella sp. PMI_491]|nr:hypothetical protein GQ53DRAFT_798035 [Thozetella sp. PMI_491]